MASKSRLKMHELLEGRFNRVVESKMLASVGRRKVDGMPRGRCGIQNIIPLNTTLFSPNRTFSRPETKDSSIKKFDSLKVLRFYLYAILQTLV